MKRKESMRASHARRMAAKGQFSTFKANPRKPKPRAALRPVSLKKAEWNRHYLAKLKVIKEGQIARTGHTFCEHCKLIGPVDGHHTQSRHGANILVFILLCRKCHEAVHNCPNWARREGLLK